MSKPRGNAIQEMCDSMIRDRPSGCDDYTRVALWMMRSRTAARQRLKTLPLLVIGHLYYADSVRRSGTSIHHPENPLKYLWRCQPCQMYLLTFRSLVGCLIESQLTGKGDAHAEIKRAVEILLRYS